MKCNICGKDGECRLGACFDCAEAESIILDGVDMYDKGIDGGNKQAEKAMEKLRFLISKGWKKV